MFRVILFHFLVPVVRETARFRNESMHQGGLHGPSMFAVKAKIYGVLYKQSSSIAFDETSSYWLAPKNS